MLHDPKTVIGSDFDQETAQKIGPPFISRLELANYSYPVFSGGLGGSRHSDQREMCRDRLHKVQGETG